MADDVDLKALAGATDGLVGSDIEAMCRRAVMLAIREFLSKPKASDFTKCRMKAKHLEEAMRTLGR